VQSSLNDSREIEKPDALGGKEIVSHIDANDIMHQLKIAQKERKPRRNPWRSARNNNNNNHESTEDEEEQA